MGDETGIRFPMEINDDNEVVFFFFMSNLQEHQREQCQWNVKPDISCGDKCIHRMLEKKKISKGVYGIYNVMLGKCFRTAL